LRCCSMSAANTQRKAPQVRMRLPDLLAVASLDRFHTVFSPAEMPRYPQINPIAQAALSFTIMAGRARRDALKARQEELRDRLQTTQIEFVLTELDTSITFCDLALASKDPMKTRRNVQNARTGYETALRFSQKVQPYLTLELRPRGIALTC
jgi:hypothetical protein